MPWSSARSMPALAKISDRATTVETARVAAVLVTAMMLEMPVFIDYQRCEPSPPQTAHAHRDAAALSPSRRFVLTIQLHVWPPAKPDFTSSRRIIAPTTPVTPTPAPLRRQGQPAHCPSSLEKPGAGRGGGGQATHGGLRPLPTYPLYLSKNSQQADLLKPISP